MSYLLPLAVAPGAYMVYLVYKQDKIEKEPASLIRMLLLGGAIAVMPAIIIEIVAELVLNLVFTPGSYIYIALEAFLGVALVEEGVKYFALKKITWDHPAFNYTFDAIVYAVTASMGFAIIENIAYVFENGLVNAILRAVTAIPGHAVFGVYMGFYYGCAKKLEADGDMKGAAAYLKRALWMPVLIHGFYDFCLMSDSGLLVLVFLAFIIALYVITFKRLKNYSKNDMEINEEQDA